MTPYLRSANVGYGTLDLSDVLEMNYDPAERKKFGLQYGDVVVSEGSASRECGRDARHVAGRAASARLHPDDPAPPPRAGRGLHP